MAGNSLMSKSSAPPLSQSATHALSGSQRVAQSLSALPDRAQVTLAAGAFADRAGNTTAAVTWSFDLARWARSRT